MQKVVALLNDFDTANRVLAKAIEIAQEQDVSLETLFVHEAPLFSLPDFFLNLEHKESVRIDEKKIRDELGQRVEKLGFSGNSAIFVSTDDTADRAAAHTRDESDVLIVSAYHETISKALAKKAHTPILILKKDSIAGYKDLSIPIELDESAEQCITLSRSLFPQGNIHLIYDNHYLTDREEAERQKATFERIVSEMNAEGDYIEEFVWNEADYGEDFALMETHLKQLIEKSGSDLTVLCSGNDDLLYGEAVSLSLLQNIETDFLIARRLT